MNTNLLAVLFSGLLGGAALNQAAHWAKGALKLRGAQLKGVVPADKADAVAADINAVSGPLVDVLTKVVAQQVSNAIAPHTAAVGANTAVTQSLADLIRHPLQSIGTTLLPELVTTVTGSPQALQTAIAAPVPISAHVVPTDAGI